MPLLDKPASKITSEICDDVKGFELRLLDVLKNTESMEHELNLHRKAKTEAVELLQEVEILTSTYVNLTNGTILSLQEDLMTSRKRFKENSMTSSDTISNTDKETKSRRKQERFRLNNKIKELEKKNAKAEKDLTSSLKRERALQIELTKLQKKNASLIKLSFQAKRPNLFSDETLAVISQGMDSFDDLGLSSASTPEVQPMGVNSLALMEDDPSSLPIDVVRSSSHGKMSIFSSDDELRYENQGGIGREKDKSGSFLGGYDTGDELDKDGINIELGQDEQLDDLLDERYV